MEPSKTGHSGRYLCAATFRIKHSFAGSVPKRKAVGRQVFNTYSKIFHWNAAML